ncbi:hypothetical protein NDU88_005187 [Pleurodeles waltl]|uniref:Uncharacterized protein n=1 Tax=Pleurodeles waltl TaxID=8319 RepID=A0AAV7VKX8_PLEWA|nr:hypothetical protein NDU88_005187 [Pleurodeles waltl]
MLPVPASSRIQFQNRVTLWRGGERVGWSRTASLGRSLLSAHQAPHSPTAPAHLSEGRAAAAPRALTDSAARRATGLQLFSRPGPASFFFSLPLGEGVRWGASGSFYAAVISAAPPPLLTACSSGCHGAGRQASPLFPDPFPPYRSPCSLPAPQAQLPRLHEAAILPCGSASATRPLVRSEPARSLLACIKLQGVHRMPRIFPGDRRGQGVRMFMRRSEAAGSAALRVLLHRPQATPPP